MKLAAVVLLLCTLVMAQSSDTKENFKADLIFRHGNIYTGAKDHSTFGDTQRRAEAMALKGDRIVAIGAADEVMKWKGPQTEIVDLNGNFVMPGFNDAHLHLAEAGFQKLSVNLNGVKSLDEFRRRIAERVASAGPGEWLTGGGWDETFWPVKTPPNRWDLDEVSAGHPIFLQRVDAHIAVANTRALQLASITVASRDPEGGKIDRDESGTPTGILRETARDAVFGVIPKPTHDKRRQAIAAALGDAVQWGVTSLQDNSSWEDFQMYEELEREGKLPLRISEWLPFDASLDALKSMRDSHPLSDNLLHTGMLKGFMDGSLGSRTAALLQPYADDPKNAGLPRYEAEKLNEMTTERVEAGFQIGFHAIGDKGVQMALDAFAAAEQGSLVDRGQEGKPKRDLRLRIEHAQVTSPAEIQKFKSLKVVASMQPNHLLTDMNWAQDRIGPQRAAHSYAWAEFLSSGVRLAFGTDYPVEPITPFRGLYAAVTRQSEDGKRRYYPEQRLTIDQAIAAYTAGSAYAEYAEKEKGSLQPGMLADFVVLDRDITAVPAVKILQAKVLRTVVGGKTVYQSK
jgi:predicted amidohydrolase YtcJ